MRTSDSFYNPDEQQAFEFHQRLLKIAERERLASQAFLDRERHEPSRRPSISLKARLQSLFGYRPTHSHSH